MFSLKKIPHTDFELRNEEAGKAYEIREAKKEIVRKIVLGIGGLVVITTAAAIIMKYLDVDNLPLENQ